MKKLFFCFFLFPFSLNAQQIKFQYKFQVSGNAEGYCIQEVKGHCTESNSGYIIITEAYTLIRTDLLGNILWQKQFNFLDGGFSDYVEETSDCGFLIAGSVLDSNLSKNYVLIKTDIDGNLEWSRQYIPPANDSLFNDSYDFFSYGNEYRSVGVKARQTDDDGYVILGQINSSGSNLMYFQIIKTDSSGNVRWTRFYNSNPFVPNSNYFDGISSHVYDIDIAGYGITKGFILLGQISNTLSDDNYIVLIRIDNAGSILWSKKYLTPDAREIGYAIKETNDRGFIITGSYREDVLAFKTDSSGNIEWLNYYDRPQCSDDEYLAGNSIKQTYDGGYIIGCNHGWSALFMEAVLIKIDTSGNREWSMAYQRHRSYNGSDARCVIQTTDSGYAFCGAIGDVFHLPDVFFVKTDANGYSGCFDSLLYFCPFTDSFPEFFIGDTMTVSVGDTSINPVVQSPNITVTTYCLIDDIEENKITDENIIYPNPAVDNFIIKNISSKGKISLQIRNLFGEIVYSEKLFGKNEYLIDANFAKGIYFVSLNDVEKIVVKKLVVE